MKIAYFEKLLNIGDLYLDKILFEYEQEPILFSCLDKKSQLYLCLCTDIRIGRKWTITEVSNDIMKSLLLGKMSIYDVFYNNAHAKYIITDNKLTATLSSNIIFSSGQTKTAKYSITNEGLAL